VPVPILKGGNILPFEPEFSGMLVKRIHGKKCLVECERMKVLPQPHSYFDKPSSNHQGMNITGGNA
jgi:hypothetical protein